PASPRSAPSTPAPPSSPGPPRWPSRSPSAPTPTPPSKSPSPGPERAASSAPPASPRSTVSLIVDGKLSRWNDRSRRLPLLANTRAPTAPTTPQSWRRRAELQDELQALQQIAP